MFFYKSSYLLHDKEEHSSLASRKVTEDFFTYLFTNELDSLPPICIHRFDRIEVNDEGEYICTATNIAGTSSASAVLKVRSPPEIVLSQPYVDVPDGDPVNIDCRASGYPEPTVTITKGK